MLKNGLARSPHIREHRLAKVPTQKRVAHSIRAIRLAARRVQDIAVDTKDVKAKTHNLVAVLQQVQLI
jgi:hypothetical protein